MPEDACIQVYGGDNTDGRPRVMILFSVGTRRFRFQMLPDDARWLADEIRAVAAATEREINRQTERLLSTGSED